MNIEQAAGNTSVTVTDTTVWVTRRVTEPSYGEEMARPIWQWTPTSAIAKSESSPAAQEFSPWTEQLFPVTIKLRKAARLNIGRKNVRLLHQWFRRYTTVWTAASNKYIPHLVNLAHAMGRVRKLSKNLEAISKFWTEE